MPTKVSSGQVALSTNRANRNHSIDGLDRVQGREKMRNEEIEKKTHEKEKKKEKRKCLITLTAIGSSKTKKRNVKRLWLGFVCTSVYELPLLSPLSHEEGRERRETNPHLVGSFVLFDPSTLRHPRRGIQSVFIYQHTVLYPHYGIVKSNSLPYLAVLPSDQIGLYYTNSAGMACFPPHVRP